jgi:hypothetical protein
MEENAEKKQDENEEAPEFSKIVFGLGLAIIVLGAIVYAGYTYSQKKSSKTVFPAGYQTETKAVVANDWTKIDCNTEKFNSSNPWPYVLKCDRFKTDASTKMIYFVDKQAQFSIQLPNTLKTVEFPNGLGVDYKGIPIQFNLLYNLDFASSRSGELKNLKGEEYVKNYWKAFPGVFSGVKSFEVIKNSNDETGFKAVYNLANNVPPPGIDVFFELTPGSNDYVHFASGALDESVFNAIVGSYKRGTAVAVPTSVVPTK